MALIFEDISMGIESDTPESIQPSLEPAKEVSKMTVESILSQVKSGIGLDIAKNHTGVCLWRNGVVETVGFALDSDYDKSDYMAEAKMRLQFKEKLYDILKDETWEVCVVEDVYGGENFDTTRKLIALNCVVDELVLEGKIHIDNIYRFKEPEWMRDFRKILRVGKKPSTKFECQEILKYMGYPFAVDNSNLKDVEKQKIFYEDICDATAQLCSLCLKLRSPEPSVKKSSTKLTEIHIEYVSCEYDIDLIDDSVIAEFGYCMMPEAYSEYSSIENCVIDLVKSNPDVPIAMEVPTSMLGTWGIKNGLKFYHQGSGFLVAYDKKLRKELTR